MAWAQHDFERVSIFSAQLSHAASRAVAEDIKQQQVGYTPTPSTTRLGPLKR